MKKKINKFKVHTRIRNRQLSAIQIEKIKKIVMTLAHYIFLDRETLNFFAGEKIGLSYITIARDYNIIAETQNQKQMQKKEEYFFELGENGIFILNLDKIEFHQLPLLVDRNIKEKILNFNRYLEKYEKKIKYEVIDENYNIFRFEQQIYYYETIKENEVIDYFRNEILKNKKENQEIKDYFYENFNLIKIPKNQIKIYGQTKQTY